MRFKATFISGETIVGTLDFEEHWEDFIQRYESDQVLQKKIWFETMLGCPVSIDIKPITVKPVNSR